MLSGRLRLLLGEHDLTLGAGEVAEFDTRPPHWFGKPDPTPTETLFLFGRGHRPAGRLPQGARRSTDGGVGA